MYKFGGEGDYIYDKDKRVVFEMAPGSTSSSLPPHDQDRVKNSTALAMAGLTPTLCQIDG